MKLYELTGQMKELALIDDMPPEAIADTLESINLEFKDKAINIRHVLFEFDGNISVIDSEIARLTAIKKAANARKEALIDYLRINMEASGIDKIEAPTFKITLKSNRPTVFIEDESLIPDEYVRVKTDISPDKVALYAALKNGPVPGARLNESKNSVIIK